MAVTLEPDALPMVRRAEDMPGPPQGQWTYNDYVRCLPTAAAMKLLSTQCYTWRLRQTLRTRARCPSSGITCWLLHRPAVAPIMAGRRCPGVSVAGSCLPSADEGRDKHVELQRLCD